VCTCCFFRTVNSGRSSFSGRLLNLRQDHSLPPQVQGSDASQIRRSFSGKRASGLRTVACFPMFGFPRGRETFTTAATQMGRRAM